MNTGRLEVNGRFVKFGFKGLTDLMGFTKEGRAVFCEIKTGSGRLSPVQENFRKVAESFNCHYLLCRSLEDFDKFFAMLSSESPLFTNNLSTPD